jgi:hypothetical protein
MKVNEIKEIAKNHNIKIGKATKSELVRAIQLAEGNLACFATDRFADCQEHSCMWREDCGQ